MSTAGPLRQPIPVARSILWSPAGEDGGGQRPGHLPFPVFLAQSALTAIHEHVAAPARPGQVALLLGTDPEEPAAGFFRAGPDEAWTSTPLAFYELLGPDSIRPDGKKRSFVTWKNHRAYNPVTPSAAATLRTPAAKPPSE